VAQAEEMLARMKAQVCSISDYNTSRLIVELETGGNIRLEDGKPSDVWYSSCVDLVNSRFFQQVPHTHTPQTPPRRNCISLRL